MKSVPRRWERGFDVLGVENHMGRSQPRLFAAGKVPGEAEAPGFLACPLQYSVSDGWRGSKIFPDEPGGEHRNGDGRRVSFPSGDGKNLGIS